ncbi:helix-turn-helix domain-containing protein, partial [Rhodococcus sp. IEGM 1366]|uniref:PucR family transcriptional regulator n=1 Tax=Rhodococcus sp. IEGM 1366 TaxID=3082223 RepID=UPI002955DA4A
VVATGRLILIGLVDNLAVGKSATDLQLEMCRAAAERRFTQGITVETMLQGYRAWGKVVWRLIQSVAAESHIDPDATMYVAGRVMEFVDSVSTAATQRSIEFAAGTEFERAMLQRDLLGLLTADPAPVDQATQLARDLGFPLDLPAVAVIVRRHLKTVSSDDRLHDILRRLDSVCTRQGRAAVMGVTTHGLVCVAALRRSEQVDDVTRELKTVLAESTGDALSVGVGTARIGVEGISKSFLEAVDAVAVCSPGRVLGFEQSLLDNLLRRSQYRTAILECTVERLRAYDDASGTSLLDTLRAYVGTRHSLTRTAVVMHVQPNSVSYRLMRIAAITGHDPRTPDGLLLLSLATWADSSRH